MWVWFSLMAAFTLATSDAFTKKALANGNEYLVAWLRLLFSVPPLIAVLIFVEPPTIHTGFYSSIAMALPLEVLAMVLYVKALRNSPLSLTLPFLSLTPVFLILFSYLILGEKVTARGAAGIVLMAAGGYALNLHHTGKGLLDPLKAVMRERGSLYMIAVALIYSITSSLGKRAINASSALYFAAIYFLVFTVIFTPLGLMGMRSGGLRRSDIRHLLPAGLFFAAMVISHMVAMSLGKVAYMIAVKRVSLLIGVLYGYLFFREEHIRERFVGASLMFAGLVLLVGAD